jgi:hypothetical protein
MGGGRRIGLDFDNTIVIYDQVFVEIGRREGLLPEGFAGNKDQVRSFIRALPDGEAKWTGLQALVYGPGILQARLATGLTEFLAACRAAQCELFIVSHKTEYAAAAPNGANLRDAARAWLAAQGLTGRADSPFNPEHVFFADTRQAKIERIAALQCACFVDDLEEVFEEPTFPTCIERHLIKLDAPELPAGPFAAWRNWSDLKKAIFGGC